MLGANNYGKAEVRVARVHRGASHTLTDLNVSVTLAGDLADTHLTGSNANVLPTDTQKNTVYAFAREHGIDAPESFGLRLARHFVASQPTISTARVSIEEYAWRRLGPHSFARSGEYVRTCAVTSDGTRDWVVSGISDLVLLNTTDSEFHGFITDRYTTLAPATDRILATAVNASWRYSSADSEDWNGAFEATREAMVGAFVGTYSLSLQQTLHAMGAAVLDAVPAVAEVRLALPNRHHFLVDLDPFDLDNPGEVYFPADRPYGLIEGTVLRDGAPPAGLAWSIHRSVHGQSDDSEGASQGRQARGADRARNPTGAE